jgi:hypothetical protein
MKKISLLILIVVLLALLLPAVSMAGNPNKVEICHIPPGNPENAHTIVVDDSAVPAHLAHGDFVGICGGG